MWLVRFALKNPYAIGVLALLIVVLGLLAVSSIPVDILPVFKAPAVEVLTFYQGMPTPDVEKTLTNRIERWTNQATGMENIESKSILGVSVVRLYFHQNTDPNGALTQVNSLALGTLPTLPPNTLPPVVLPFDPTGTIPLGILSVTSKDLNETRVKDVARIDIRNMLGSVRGVVAPAVFGGKDRTVLIYVDPKALQARNLSQTDVVNALQQENLMVTPGLGIFGRYEYQLDSNAMVRNVPDFNSFPIRIQPGNQVFLRDIGRAEDSHTVQTSLVRVNGRREVYVPIYRQQGSSSLSVIDAVKKNLPDMMQTLKGRGYDVALNLVMDQSVFVREAIKSLIHEGIIGAALVSIMILIFLGNWRMTVIASLAIPLAILCGIIGLYGTGNTINAMTLGGLALAIGPLVDNAIVVLENTHRHQTEGASRTEAAFDGAVELTIPVLVATLSTIIVLCPIALTPGMGGFLFRPLTLAVAFAMLASFLLSWTLVPTLCAIWLKPPAQAGTSWGQRLHHPIERFLEKMTHQYRRLLLWALRWRLLVLGVVLALFAGSLLLYFGIGQEFFPQVDAGQIAIAVRAPSGTSLDAAETRMAAVEQFLEDTVPKRERQMIITELGLDPDWSAAYTQNSASWDAVINLQLTPARTKSAQEYAIDLRHKLAAEPRFADLGFSFDTGGMITAALNYGATSPISIQVEGGTRKQEADVAHDIVQRVRGIRGAADVHVKQRLDAPELYFEIERQKAADAGLSAKDVIDQVATALNSSIGLKHNFWIDVKSGNQYFVAVQYPQNPNMDLRDVLNIVATGTHQATPVKLGELVHVLKQDTAVEVNHVNLARITNVLVNTENRDLGGVAKAIQARLHDIKLPPGIHVSLQGEYKRMTESFRSLAFGLLLAATLVYLLLVALFRSWLGPFLIMLTVPLGLIGVLTMLYVTHTTLNVQSEMGVIFMVGIAVSNGVLLVDFANRQRSFGASVHEAIVTAANIRVRPILMTFLATFFDLLPMAIGFGRGSEANIPLARAVVGGLLSSTLLTLFVVPILYTLLTRDRPPKDPRDDVDVILARRAKEKADAATNGAHVPANGRTTPTPQHDGNLGGRTASDGS